MGRPRTPRRLSNLVVAGIVAVAYQQSICENLQSAGGFDRCTADIKPYSGSEFVDPNEPFQLANGMYPHRTASYFSTIQRCMVLVASAERQLRSNISNSSSGGDGYLAIMVTRHDISARPKVPVGVSDPAVGLAWWSGRCGGSRFDAVAGRRVGVFVVEDRGLLGSPAAMPFEHLYTELPALLSRVRAKHAISHSELLLWNYLVTGGGPEPYTPHLRVGNVESEVSLD